MELILILFEILLPVIVSMDPSLLRISISRSLRLHDDFRLIRWPGKNPDLMLLPHDLDSSVSPTPMLSNALQLNQNGRTDVRWQRTINDLQYSQSSNSDGSLDTLSSKLRSTNILNLFLRSGNQTEQTEQARLPRQALHFQNFFREQCSSHLINAFLTMIPDANRPDSFKLQGSLAISADNQDLFAVIKYTNQLCQFFNKNANRTVCVHPENGTLYSSSLELYTHQEAHPCVFERISVFPNRSWCRNQNGLSGNIYLTTVGVRRALAMTNKARSLQPEVITIPWSESGGPVDSCSPPPRGCYSWRETKQYNCGVDGNEDCVTYSTVKTTRTSVATTTTATTTTTTVATTSSSSSSTFFTSTSDFFASILLPKANREKTREGRKCAVKYCRKRAEIRWRQSGHQSPSDEVPKCVDAMMTRLRQSGDQFRNSLCNQQSFDTKPKMQFTTDNNVLETEKTVLPRLVLPTSLYNSLPSKFMRMPDGENSDLHERYRGVT